MVSKGTENWKIRFLGVQPVGFIFFFGFFFLRRVFWHIRWPLVWAEEGKIKEWLSCVYKQIRKYLFAIQHHIQVFKCSLVTVTEAHHCLSVFVSCLPHLNACIEQSGVWFCSVLCVWVAGVVGCVLTVWVKRAEIMLDVFSHWRIRSLDRENTSLGAQPGWLVSAWAGL